MPYRNFVRLPARSAGVIAQGRAHIRRRIHALRACGMPAFIAGWTVLVQDLEHEFRVEEGMLEAAGCTDLPACRHHHAIILAAMHGVTPDVERGDLKLGRRTLSALLDFLADVRTAPAPCAGRQYGWRRQLRRMETSLWRTWPRRPVLAPPPAPAVAD